MIDTYPWNEVGTIDYDSGDVGGDHQIGPASSRRFQLTVDDGTFAVVTTYAYATLEERVWDGEGNLKEEPEPFLDVEELTESIICTDPDDPGGTEIWSRYEYSTPLYYAPKDEEDALRLARRQTENESVEYINHWNGKPTD